tara:strand:- start:277 stop:1068 length:792 start_codon:yes stop_codon:yes gene_type:complete
VITVSIELERCFLLHQRPYRETSVIAELLTEHEGRVSLVCKGVRSAGKKASSLRSTLQPFTLLNASWSGKTDLKSLRQAEVITPPPRLHQSQLYAGLYLNELLFRLFHSGESHTNLFSRYQASISEIASLDPDDTISIEVSLRRFEARLLATLGFELDFMRDAITGEPITADGEYRFHTENGFCRVDSNNGDPDNEYSEINVDSVLGLNAHPSIAGSVILAIKNDDYHDKKVRQLAKKIMRLALAPHLGGRPLKSRELYRRPD